MKPGDKVRLTEQAKRRMTGSRGLFDSAEHIDEFGECVGVVVGLVEEGYPELDVRWLPSGLKYGYHPSDLEVT